ncbi:nucleotidyltransferase family protein [Halomonas sp. PR-M31]|uniref:type VII toxin-antitoxin system MntA family adenylyltransferase antitoxin n=1 Tax=Halomonas sp. PR-M31 TaxID=1471202 RepID=UPI0012E14412|nr:nucleotidyltransferase domain-containing protein [Halomonas sp. PR-M31]
MADFSEIEQIVLFSSLGRGAGRPDSDIVVAVEADRRLTPEQRIAMIEVLAIEFGCPVDLVDLKAAGQPLLTQIVTTGKRLLVSDTFIMIYFCIAKIGIIFLFFYIFNGYSLNLSEHFPSIMVVILPSKI